MLNSTWRTFFSPFSYLNENSVSPWPAWTVKHKASHCCQIKPQLAHMYKSLVLPAEGPVVFTLEGTSFLLPLLKDQFDMSEIFLKGPLIKKYKLCNV